MGRCELHSQPKTGPSKGAPTSPSLSWQVYIRKGRLLLALRAVRQALRLAGPAHPRVHLALLRLAQRAAQLPPAAAPAAAAAEGQPNPMVAELVQQGVKEALGGASLQVGGCMGSGKTSLLSLW